MYIKLGEETISLKGIRRVSHNGNGSFSGSNLYITYEDGTRFHTAYIDTENAEKDYKTILDHLVILNDKGE